MNSITLTRPLPKGYEISKGPNGTLSILNTDTGTGYSADAWSQIEAGRGLWRDLHDMIFGPKED